MTRPNQVFKGFGTLVSSKGQATTFFADLKRQRVVSENLFVQFRLRTFVFCRQFGQFCQSCLAIHPPIMKTGYVFSIF